jgi:hypothetical protein
MKNIKIRSIKYTDPAINWDFQAEEAEPKLSELLESGVCGKPERWVLHKDEPMAEAYDEADVLEERIVDGLDGASHKEVKLKAEYTIEIEDVTDKLEQERINAEALKYLADTDWMIIREMDAGIVCPEDVKLARAEARSKIVRMD